MSRLQSAREKQISKRIVSLITVMGAIVILIGIFGLKSLINAAIFINHSLSGTTKSVNTDTSQPDFFGTFELDEPHNATNEATIELGGSVNGYDTVDVYLNRKKVSTAKIRDNQFSATVSDLKQDENKVGAIAKTNDGKHTKKSEEYTVIFTNDPPKLDIAAPHDGDSTSKQDLAIEGKTLPHASMRVNNMPVVVDWQGTFKTTFRLKDGDNTLEFVVHDDAGNATKQTMHVKYQKDE